MVDGLISKHRGHLLHVTNAYHGLEEKYALLEPMLFDKTFVEKHKNRGFEVLRQALFFSCVVDVVNIVVQKGGKQASSIEGIASIFCNQKVLKSLHNAILNADVFVGNPEIQEGQNQVFWANVGSTKTMIDCLLHSQQIKVFETIRDKRIAHLELKKSGKNYELLDISTLGLKWNDIQAVLAEIKTIIFNLNIIMTGVNLADRTELNKNMSDKFWDT